METGRAIAPETQSKGRYETQLRSPFFVHDPRLLDNHDHTLIKYLSIRWTLFPTIGSTQSWFRDMDSAQQGEQLRPEDLRHVSVYGDLCIS